MAGPLHGETRPATHCPFGDDGVQIVERPRSPAVIIAIVIDPGLPQPDPVQDLDDLPAFAVQDDEPLLLLTDRRDPMIPLVHAEQTGDSPTEVVGELLTSGVGLPLPDRGQLTAEMASGAPELELIRPLGARAGQSPQLTLGCENPVHQQGMLQGKRPTLPLVGLIVYPHSRPSPQVTFKLADATGKGETRSWRDALDRRADNHYRNSGSPPSKVA